MTNVCNLQPLKEFCSRESTVFGRLMSSSLKGESRMRKCANSRRFEDERPLFDIVLCDEFLFACFQFNTYFLTYQINAQKKRSRECYIKNIFHQRGCQDLIYLNNVVLKKRFKKID